MEKEAKTRRVLITGLRGFTGHYVSAEFAAQGWEVWGIGSRPWPEMDRYYCVDIATGVGLEAALDAIRPQVVIHLAAIAFVGHSDANALYTVNLLGTRNLLRALAECAQVPAQVIVASSANVYGNSCKERIDEATPLQPENDYAVSKMAMEAMARLWMDTLPLLITRPFNYIGVGQAQSFLVAKIAAAFCQKQESIELGNLDVWRDFSDVRTVAQAYRLLAEKAPMGETVNICSGRLVSLRDIINLCTQITGHQIKIDINPAFIRAKDIEKLCGDPRKLHSLIGELHSPPLEQTLGWILESTPF